MNVRLVSLLATVWLTAGAPGQEPAAPAAPAGPVRDVSIELLCVSLPQAQALPLIRQFRSGSAEDRTRTMAELWQLLDKGSAKLVGWPTLRAHEGVRAEHRALEEVRYATEFTAAGVSVFLGDKEGNLVDNPGKTFETQPIASGFDTRNTGLSFEGKATVGDVGELAVEFSAEHVRIKSIDKSTVERVTDKKSEKTIQEVPRFTALKVASELTVTAGDPTLIGLFNVPETEGHLELFILTANVVAKK